MLHDLTFTVKSLTAGNTPGTLHVVRTASELYQQQRAAIAQPTAYRVASGTGVSNSNQPVTYSRSPILYNTAGGNFVTPGKNKLYENRF